MRIKPILFFAAVTALAGWIVYREATTVGTPGVISIGQRAPDFEIKDPSGEGIKLSDFRGNLVFLNFWATWCPPCVDEMPAMELVNRAFKDRKFQMIAVSVDTDWEKVFDFYKKHNLTLPSYLDPGHEVDRKYNVFKFPGPFIMDLIRYV